MKILKFGGTSISSSKRIQNVTAIIREQWECCSPIAVVVSAFGGVTDALIQISQQAVKTDRSYSDELEKLNKRHNAILEDLVPEKNKTEAKSQVAAYFNEINDILHGILLTRELSKRSLDLIMSFGEILSAYIISETLKSLIPCASFLDAREVIKTDRNFGAARINYEKTYPLIQKYFQNHQILPIITGFIGSTDEGETTTLGRGGSDFTASLFGAGLDAKEIEIWTDVDGVMTADPRKVQQAFPIPAMTYKEALEMSHFGAKVIHPPTITPALKKNIPIRIKNTFNPQAPGTFISNKSQNHGAMICGISSIDTIALLRIEGSGMVGVYGVAMRLFGALAKNEISIILITQASSEHSICIAVVPQHAIQAKEAIESEFFLEKKAGLIDPVIIEEPLSIVAVVGENMRNIPGIVGKLFSALGKNGVNVVAIAQGSSEYNISVVIKKIDESKALNLIHEEFFLSQKTTLHLFLIGTGLIGSTLLAQIQKHLPELRKEYALDIKIVGIANSQKMKFNSEGIKMVDWNNVLSKSAHKMDLSTYIEQMKSLNLINSIFVDCTANETIAKAYESILAANISIVTPNKKAASGNYSTYKALKDLSKWRGVNFIYEANVGAGLPIISTVANLRRSGDKIIKIEAILSGTLSYLFNSFTNGKKFSEVLLDAQKKGFTEPDPRDDLNGKDLMRKLLILARESGYPIEMEDITIEYLLPQECFEASTIKEFYYKLKAYDPLFEEERQKALQEGKALRYIATLIEGKGSISLQAVDQKHPFYNLSGTDNIISLTTNRYRETPLIIRGQGAGAEVTSGEVFADIIRIGANNSR